MRNSKKNRKGIAIELAILTLAITAIFCTIAVTTTLQESKFIKAELEDLDKKCKKLEYEKDFKAILYKVDINDIVDDKPSMVNDKFTLFYKPVKDKNAITITEFEWASQITN